MYGRSSQTYDPPPQGILDQFQRIVNTQFVHEIGLVPLNGFGGYSQHLRSLAGLVALDNQLHRFPLPVG